MSILEIFETVSIFCKLLLFSILEVFFANGWAPTLLRKGTGVLFCSRLKSSTIRLLPTFFLTDFYVGVLSLLGEADLDERESDRLPSIRGKVII